jgi:proteasome alpha subunit
VSMPFYVSPAQQVREKAEYASQGVARGRSCVALRYADGILMVTPNSSSALHKISELYDTIAFAAVGRYNEYENLRRAGVTYADVAGYQYDRTDVTVRGIVNWYAQTLGNIFSENTKPFEVELVVAEVGEEPAADQIYRVTFDGSVTEEPTCVAFGGDAARVTTALKERYTAGMSLAQALGAALIALTAPATSGSSAAGSNGSAELTASQLEVAILDRARDHRKFRRITGARLEELMTEARAAAAAAKDAPDAPPAEDTPDA